MTAHVMMPSSVTFEPSKIAQLCDDPARPLVVVRGRTHPQLGLSTGTTPGDLGPGVDVLAVLPGMFAEWLGSRSFRKQHGLRYAYVGGAMARGIASEELCVALARHGCLGFFGAAGLRPEQVEASVARLRKVLGDVGWGANLIHSPQEPELEDRIVGIYLKQGVSRISASAFMDLRPSVVRFAYKGLTVDTHGNVVRRHHVFAKVSRTEVAEPFFHPAPDKMLRKVVEAGWLTQEEARLGATIPVASAVTAEADSGGHTDQRSLPALVPCILDLRDRAAERCPAARDVHVGAAGGIGDPRGLSGALAMGADYVLLGSVHQSTLEAGISAHAKALLAKADMADTAMTAAGDMFESGVKVQVLRKGTMMAVRGNELFDLYRRHDSYEAIPLATRARLEKTVFGRAVEDIWHETRAYHQAQDPAVVARAEREPKYKLGLLFRWYLGKSSRWPVVGDSSRTSDYQIWCGPSMGAFNRWTKGTSLELPENRSVAVVAAALLRGSLQLQRQQLLQSWGLPVSRPLARPMAALPMTG